MFMWVLASPNLCIAVIFYELRRGGTYVGRGGGENEYMGLSD